MTTHEVHEPAIAWAAIQVTILTQESGGLTPNYRLKIYWIIFKLFLHISKFNWKLTKNAFETSILRKASPHRAITFKYSTIAISSSKVNTLLLRFASFGANLSRPDKWLRIVDLGIWYILLASETLTCLLFAAFKASFKRCRCSKIVKNISV